MRESFGEATSAVFSFVSYTNECLHLETISGSAYLSVHVGVLLGRGYIVDPAGHYSASVEVEVGDWLPAVRDGIVQLGTGNFRQS
ncbi:hypothetical protein AVEN_34699-1 [Araneus ventricosus]|uniref:Uncharacterized protein n=1 Tax=Araneus ventricosus TaxID=182803 RepID=A0A4Y2B2P1_ARAVE|nr:hypothetical protein AVEN_34699-1 [Araneus ventricosus]